MQSIDPLSPNETVESLESKLSELAFQFRAGVIAQQSVVGMYRDVFRRLLQYREWSGEPEVDSQLPSEFMPEEYLRFWDKKRRSIASIVRNEMTRWPGIGLKISAEEFLSKLATVIQAANLEFGLPSPDDAHRIVTACRQLARLSIFLNAKLQGESTGQMIWCVCKRVLWMADIELDDDGHSEFIEKLCLSGISGRDVNDTLRRYCRPIRVQPVEERSATKSP